MEILMGGSGSTGSSLLKNILNRHETIFSGGETAFFAKKMIYENWDKVKLRVLKRKFRGLRNHGWHIYNGTDLLQPEYLWQKNELGALLKESRSLHEFTSSFYSKALNLKGANIWLEKTPANSACFRYFLNSFENGKVVHMVRNPFDTIASLMNRGFDVYYATGIYLLNSASGISTDGSDQSYREVKYEDLTMKPTQTVSELCDFLGVDFSVNMLKPQGEVVHKPKLEGWQYDETREIGKGSVGRFKNLSDEMQDTIVEAVNLIKINNRGKAYYDLKVSTIAEICDRLGYDFYNIGSKHSLKTLKKFLLKDRLGRLRRGYPTGIYYPLEIRN